MGSQPGEGPGSAVSYRRVRILVTNDDGVHAAGLAALVRALATWAALPPRHDVVVVAPMANHSGAAAAVGTVYERESIPYAAHRIEGAEHIPTYGLDAPPALSVLVAALGGFGPTPDLVLSGINLGVNVGRSVLHSGTVGACLTGAQLGISGLAVSLRTGAEVEHWETAAELAVSLVDALAAAPARTVWNLNVPSLPFTELRGLRRARVSGAGLVKAAFATRHPGGVLPWPPAAGDEEGEIEVKIGSSVPPPEEIGAGPPEDDSQLVGAGWASLTPLRGAHEDTDDAAVVAADRALDAGAGALARLAAGEGRSAVGEAR